MNDDRDQGAIDEVISFWFSERARAHWFDSSPVFDAMVAERLLPLHIAAAEGGLTGWTDSPHGCLALVILLDQVPRNVFRDRPAAYATDHLAREVTRHALACAFDAQLDQSARMMLYLPLEHSEDPADQDLSVRLIGALDAEPTWSEYARKHRDVIARFGRFPHRNAVLGRESTPEETAFLAEHGTGW